MPLLVRRACLRSSPRRSQPSDEGMEELVDVKGEVRLSDVSFSYDPEKPLIEHLNVLAPAGKRVAIVGPTGCGKTTLINLLMRFYDVDGGERLGGRA